MDLGLRGKTAIITGASQGIGLEIARALHAEGVSVLVVAQTERTLREAAQRIAVDEPRQDEATVHYLVADLALRAEIERVASESILRLGQIDILVNNAARSKTGNFFAMADAEIEETFQVKALGYVRMVRALVPHMKERHQGSIINVIGNTARTPTSDFIAGSMANAALLNFTRGISRELARYNIRINCISPGWTLTQRQLKSFELQAAAHALSVEDVERQAARGIPLGRLVTTAEIAKMALLLASPLFPGMTGEDIVIDGGATPSM